MHANAWKIARSGSISRAAGPCMVDGFVRTSVNWTRRRSSEPASPARPFVRRFLAAAEVVAAGPVCPGLSHFSSYTLSLWSVDDWTSWRIWTVRREMVAAVVLQRRCWVPMERRRFCSLTARCLLAVAYAAVTSTIRLRFYGRWTACLSKVIKATVTTP